LTEKESFIFKNLVNNLNERAFFHSAQLALLGRNNPYIPVYEFAARLHRNPEALEAWNAWSNSRRPYDALQNEPLRSEIFDDRVREILENYDEL
jgi:hypothetical protein